MWDCTTIIPSHLTNNLSAYHTHLLQNELHTVGPVFMHVVWQCEKAFHVLTNASHRNILAAVVSFILEHYLCS
jgi:hypothetical protein